MSVIETTANVHAALDQAFNLADRQRRLEIIGPFMPSDADVFLAHQIRYLTEAIRELDERINRVLGA